MSDCNSWTFDVPHTASDSPKRLRHKHMVRMAWLISLMLAALMPAWTAYAACVGGTPNGDVQGAEVCDDGNMLTGDGCDNTCAIETGFVCDTPINFTGGVTTEEYPGGGTAASWTIVDRYSATQANNTTQATVGLVDAGATEYTYIIDIRVNTASDDDFIGFVLGYDPNESADSGAEYLLVDWKQLNQAGPVSGTAERGLAISRVTGIPSSNDFWIHANGVDELEEAATLGDTGWGDNTTHRFEITYSTTHLVISVDSVEQFNAVPTDYGLVAFPDGQIGFYGLSQADVSYIVYSPRASVCNQEPTINVSNLDVWTTTGNSPFSVDVVSLLDIDDPDNSGIDGESLNVLTPPPGATVEDPSDPGIPSGTLRITPSAPSNPIDYPIEIEVCDAHPVVPACDTATVTIHYNDPPTIGTQTEPVLETGSTTITIETIVADANTTQGTQTPGWDNSSLSIATTINGTYGNSAPSALGGTCEIVDGDVVYTAPSGQVGNSDSCYVQLCEAEPGPAGPPAPERACGKVQFTFANVECLSANDCTATAPVCTSNACVGCATDIDCSGHAGLPACTGDGSCGQCNATEFSECTGASVCNTTTNLCENDADGDGVANALDADADNDGIPDSVEGSLDSDGDGILNNFDLDSDNDGIPDLIENGGAALDTDHDGRIDGVGQPGFDDDGDGVADTIDGDPEDANITTSTMGIVSTDDDAEPDYLDLDSDADGVNDVIEGGGVDSGNGRIATTIDDADQDGLHDPLATTPLSLPDTNADGVVDFQDTDDDGDGVPTADELGSGGAEDPRDTDNDGMPDYQDTDDDGDGVPTADELEDTDGNGVPDYLQAESTNPTTTGGLAGGALCAINTTQTASTVMLLLFTLGWLIRRRRTAFDKGVGSPR